MGFPLKMHTKLNVLTNQVLLGHILKLHLIKEWPMADFYFEFWV